MAIADNLRVEIEEYTFFWSLSGFLNAFGKNTSRRTEGSREITPSSPIRDNKPQQVH